MSKPRKPTHSMRNFASAKLDFRGLYFRWLNNQIITDALLFCKAPVVIFVLTKANPATGVNSSLDCSMMNFTRTPRW